MMVEAGSDPRIKNKARLTPGMLVDPRNESLRRLLEEAVERGEAEREEERDFGGAGGQSNHVGGGTGAIGGGIGEQESEEDPDVGSGSDSDFDPEEYKREKERRDRVRREKAEAEAANGRPGGGMI